MMTVICKWETAVDAYCRKCGVSDNDLDDALQEIWFTAAKRWASKLGSVADSAEPILQMPDEYQRASLFRIAANVCRRVLREERLRDAREWGGATRSAIDAADTRSTSALDQLIFDETAALVEEFVRGRPPKERAILQDCWFGGLTADELIAIHGWSKESLYTLLSRSRRRLRQFLDDHGFA